MLIRTNTATSLKTGLHEHKLLFNMLGGSSFYFKMGVPTFETGWAAWPEEVHHFHSLNELTLLYIDDNGMQTINRNQGILHVVVSAC